MRMDGFEIEAIFFACPFVCLFVFFQDFWLPTACADEFILRNLLRKCDFSVHINFPFSKQQQKMGNKFQSWFFKRLTRTPMTTTNKQNSRMSDWYRIKNTETKRKKQTQKIAWKNLNTFISSFIRRDGKQENCLSLSVLGIKNARWIAVEN